MPIERLSPIMLWNGGSLLDADGEVRIEALRQAVAGRSTST